MEKKLYLITSTVLFTICTVMLILFGNRYPFWIWCIIFVTAEVIGKKLSELIILIIKRTKK